MDTIHLAYSTIEKKVVEFARNAVKKCPKYNKSLHCAVLTYKELIVSYGINIDNVNSDLGIPFQYRSLHSEFMCLRKFFKTNHKKDIRKMDLYSIRLTRHGEVKNAKPCKVCTEIINNNYPKRVFYTDDYGKFNLL